LEELESVVLVAAEREGSSRRRTDNQLRGWARAVDALLGGGRAEQEEEEPLARCRWTGRGAGLVRVDCRVAGLKFAVEVVAAQAEARKQAVGGEVLASASCRPLLPEG